ncbi:MAG: stage IV sporulation protein FB [Crocinitomicaceae bacterium]
MTEYNLYPEKPELVEHQPKSSLSLTVFSLVLFVMVFLLIFDDQLLFIVQLIIVILVHELGHFVMMKRFGYKNVRMLFIPLMGAFVQGKKRNYSERQNFWVLIAGPFPGILIGYGLMWYSTLSPYNAWLSEPAILFLLLNIINLLPLDPLDGGQLFKLFAKKRNELFLMIFALISSLILIGVGAYISNYVVIAFGFLMGFRVRALQKQFQMHKELKGHNVNYSTTYKLLSNQDFVTIKKVVLEHTPALQKFVDHATMDESNPVIASQVNNVLETPIEKDASFLFKAMILIMWGFSFFSPIILSFFFGLKWWGNAL